MLLLLARPVCKEVTLAPPALAPQFAMCPTHRVNNDLLTLTFVRVLHRHPPPATRQPNASILTMYER